MLHEVLLALIGHTGSLIVYVDDECRLSSLAEVLSEAEKALLLKICQLATYYIHITDFIKSRSSISIILMLSKQDDTDPTNDSDYTKAMCTGIQETLLEYKSKLTDIEQQCIKGSAYSLSMLIEALAVYYTIFPEITDLIEKIKNSNIKGGVLIQLLYELSLNGNQLIANSFSRILFHCKQILLYQINVWVCSGDIIDNFGEFFIQKNESEEGNGFDWWTTYRINHSMLPQCFISSILSEKILLIGKAMKVLSMDHTNQIFIEVQKFSNAINSLRDDTQFDPNKFSTIINNIKELVTYQMWHHIAVKGDLISYMKSLKNFYLLSKGEFYKAFFEESQVIFNLPPYETSERDLNNGPFHTAALRLGIEDSNHFKRYRLKLRAYKFAYANFLNASKSLSLAGNSACKNGKIYIALNSKGSSKRSNSSAIWSIFRQSVNTGFETNFTFKFGFSTAISEKVQTQFSSVNSTPKYIYYEINFISHLSIQ